MTVSVALAEYDHEPSQGENSSQKTFREYRISVEAGLSVTRKPFGSDQHQHSWASSQAWCQHYLLAVPKRVLIDLFLPVGYPQSVRPEYMSYQIFDSLQGLCSYLRGVVSTGALLTAAGVGNAEATAMSAAMTWAMRDGLGMVGGLLFSYSTSSLFDSYVKEFRLFADIINDVGLTLDMVAPHAGPDRVLYVTSMGTICKVMCGIAAGATKGSITQHFCLRGNMADLNAKEGTQETLVSLIGMLLGIALARYLHGMEQRDESFTAVVSWTIFVFLTIVHVWANYVGVKVLRLRTLNRERAAEALSGVIDQLAVKSLDRCSGSSPTLEDSMNSIPTPEEVSESLWSSTRTLLFTGRVRLGVRATKILDKLSPDEVISLLMEEFAADHYFLSIIGKRTISVALRVGATDHDELQAFVHAMTIQKCVELGALKKDSNAIRDQLIKR